MVVTNFVVCMQNVNISTQIYLLSIFTQPPPTMIAQKGGAVVVKELRTQQYSTQRVEAFLR